MISRELTKYHILRRNRIIDYIRRHFVPRTPEHPEISPMHPEGVEEFCQKLQNFADYLKEETLQDPLSDHLRKVIDIVEQEKIQLIDSVPILFIKERYPCRFWFAHRCKHLIHLMVKLRISLWRNPVPKKENKQVNFGLTSEQLDKIKEITERYKQLFIREYKMIRTDDEPICHEQIRELIRFVSAGTETVIQQYLFDTKCLRECLPEVTIDVCAKLNEINFNVCLCGLHRNVGQTINVLTEIANKCTRGK